VAGEIFLHPPPRGEKRERREQAGERRERREREERQREVHTIPSSSFVLLPVIRLILVYSWLSPVSYCPHTITTLRIRRYRHAYSLHYVIEYISVVYSHIGRLRYYGHYQYFFIHLCHEIIEYCMTRHAIRPYIIPRISYATAHLIPRHYHTSLPLPLLPVITDVTTQYASLMLSLHYCLLLR